MTLIIGLRCTDGIVMAAKRAGYGIRITGLQAECDKRVIRVMNLDPIVIQDWFERRGAVDLDGVSEWMVENEIYGYIPSTPPCFRPLLKSELPTPTPDPDCSPVCPGKIFGNPYHFSDCPNRN